MALNQTGKELRQATQEELLVRFDKHAKAVLNLDYVIARYLKYIIAEFQDLSDREIVQKHLLPPEKEPELRIGNDAMVYYDIKRKVRLKDGSTAECFIYVNFEPHGYFYPRYPLVNKGFYHICRMVSSQKKRGDGDEGYKLSKVYSVWICFNPPKSGENSVTSIGLGQKSVVGNYLFPEANLDLMELLYILVGNEESENGLLQFTNTLFSKTLPWEARKEKLEAMGFQLEDEEMVSTMHDMTTEEICFYDSRFRDGWEEGMEKGREEGMEKGMEKGREETRKEYEAILADRDREIQMLRAQLGMV